MKILIFYSGGKDSQAALIWAVKQYGVDRCEAVFCDTGWENPVTYQHIQDTTKQLGVKLIILKSDNYDGMLDMATKKGRFPSTTAKFCTDELKVKPAIDYVLSHDESLIIIEGIRKNESLSRSKMEPECMYFRYYFEPTKLNKKGKPIFHTYRKKDVLKWCKTHDASKLRPLFDWTAEQVMDFIKDSGQQPNWLYYQGFSRVGCFPCIMERHRGIKLIIDNHPAQWEALKQAEKQVGSSFFTPDYIPKHAQRNNYFPTAEDVEIYLKRKNATLDMFEQETPSCMSMYNLCE